MGTKTTNTTTSNGTQTVAPPSWTMPGIQTASDKVIAALDHLPGNKYEGNFVAQPNYNPAIAAYQGAAGQAGQLATQTQGVLDGYKPIEAQFGINTPLMDTTSALAPAISAAVAPIRKQLLEQTLPGLRSSALDSGAYSNDRAMTILPSLAIGEADRNQQEIASTMAYQNLKDSADRQLAGFQADTQRGLGVGTLGADQQTAFMSHLPDLVDTIMRMRTGQGDILSHAAGLDQQQQQAGIDNATAKNQYDYMYPFQGLDIATQLLQRLSGNYGTTTSDSKSTNVQQTSGLGPILQGVMGAASLAGSLAGGGLFGGGGGGMVAAPSMTSLNSTMFQNMGGINDALAKRAGM